MPKYIDSDKLYKIFVNLCEDLARVYEVDAVEVVRCKDCKHRKKNKFCLHNMRYEDDNGFCSYGERGKYEKDN